MPGVPTLLWQGRGTGAAYFLAVECFRAVCFLIVFTFLRCSLVIAYCCFVVVFVFVGVHGAAHGNSGALRAAVGHACQFLGATWRLRPAVDRAGGGGGKK